MKVCFPFVGDTVGGSHISSLVLVDYLIKAQYEPLVLLSEIGPLSRELERLEVPFLRLPMNHIGRTLSGKIPAIWLSPWFLLKMALVLKKYDIDVVHTNDMRMHMFWTVACRLVGVRHVWHQRTIFPASRFGQLMLRSSDEIVCISNFVKTTLPPGQYARAHVVPNPVEETAIDREEVLRLRSWMCESAGVKNDAIILGSFGNLRMIKDPITLVQTFVKLSQKIDREVILGVFGDDREGWRGRLTTLLNDQNLGSRCLFLGFKRPVGPWIAACDAVLATSKGDGLGRTIIEAMSLRVPIVATDAGGHKEAVGQGMSGILVPPGNPEAMAGALIPLVNDRTVRDGVVAQAYEVVKRNYSEDQTIRPILDIYGQRKGRGDAR